MSKYENKLLAASYDHYRKTGSPDFVYRWKNADDLFFAEEALKSLQKRGLVFNVPDEVMNDDPNFIAPIPFTLSSIGIEYMSSNREP